MLILYAPADEAFARGYLAAALGLPLPPSSDGGEAPGAPRGNAAGLALSSRELAARPVSELGALVTTSRVIVPILTPAFLADPWLQLSDELASHVTVGDGDTTAGVVPLLLAACEAPLHLRANVTLDFRKPADWEDELARLRGYLAQPATPTPEVPCPYPGMRPFRADDAAYFHGRDEEIAEVLARFAAGTRELYILGPSGSGKSSLVAAGVVPRLRPAPGRQLLIRSMRPGAAPVPALIAALVSSLAAPPAPAPAAPSSPTAPLHPYAPPPPAIDHVEDALAALFLAEPTAELLVVIDQTEELFSQAPPAAQRAFAAALRALRAEPRARLLFTVRADFFAELLGSTAWMEGSKQHFDLSPMRGEMLRQAIEQPARKQHVHFEPALIDRLLADAADEPGALPLLQETLVHLWSHRRQRLLSLEEYRAMGSGGRSGLAIALAARADQTLAALPRVQQVIARRVLLRMVAFGDGHPHTRRRQPRAALRGAEPAADFDATLRALADSRLIILDRDTTLPEARRAGEALATSDASVRAELCHDMLITAWPSFARWVEARRADEQRRRQLQDHAADWVARGRGASGLLDETELAVALAWRHSEAARELGESAELTAMIAASHRALDEQKRRHRARVRAAVAGLTLFTAVSLLLTLWALLERGEAQRQETQAVSNEQLAIQQRRRSEEMLAAQYQDAGRRLLVEGHPQRAVPYLVAARERDPARTDAAAAPRGETSQEKNLRLLFRAATANFPRFTLSHDGPINDLGLDEAGALLATGGDDRSVRLWDARSGLPMAAPLLHPARIRRVLFSPDGHRLAVLCIGGSLHLWDLRGGAPVEAIIPPRGVFRTIAFSADSRLLVTSTARGEVQLWEVASATPLGPPLLHDGPIRNVVFSPDGARLAVVPEEAMAIAMWTLGPHPRVEHLGMDMANVFGAVFSPDSARAAVTYVRFGLFGLYQLGAPGRARLAAELSDSSPIQQVLFAGERLLFTTEHKVVLDAATPARAVEIAPRIIDAQLVQGGERILLWCADSTVRMLDAETGERITELEMPYNTEHVAMGRDGQLLAHAADRQATVWQLTTRRQPRLRLEPNTLGAAFSPDGELLAVTAFMGVNLWNPRSATFLATLGPPRNSAARHLRFSPDGRQLAMLAWDREVNLCSLEELLCRTLAPAWMDPKVLPIDAAVPMDFSPDGKLLAAAVSADAVQLWDAGHAGRRGLPLVHSQGEPAPTRAGISSVQFSRDGARLLIAGDDGSASIWDVASRQLLGRVRHPTSAPLTSAVWRGDGLRLATTAEDGRGMLWDGRTFQALATLDHEDEIFAAQFSPDDQRLATYGRDGALRLWDPETGDLVRLLRLDDWILRFTFTPDSARFLTITSGKVQLWDAATGELLLPTMVHPRLVPTAPPWPSPDATVDEYRRDREQSVRGLALSADGNTLLTVGMNSPARLWDLRLDERALPEWQELRARNPFAAPALPSALTGQE